MKTASITVVGEPKPQKFSETTLPPRIAELLRVNGEGLLANQLRLLAPGSPSHVEAVRRFESARKELRGWAWTRSTEVDCSVVGELLEDRGFVLAVRMTCDREKQVLSPRTLWLAHRWGSVHPCGKDLDALLAFLLAGAVVELEREPVVDLACARARKEREG